jgi:nucleoside-diphosphate-sugar epimerase
LPRKSRRILVTGATGQIGSELTVELARRHGRDNVISAFYPKSAGAGLGEGPTEYLDVTDRAALKRVVESHQVDTIYHLAGVLSAVGEEKPDLAWSVNVEGLRNVLKLSAEMGLRVFWPSSLAVFGEGAPRDNTPQDTILVPSTIYGVAKVTGELLCKYYHDSLGVDVRSVRYPGIISSRTPPGGGTTDYAVQIFSGAVERRRYTCYVSKDTVLPMMYMPDCIRAAVGLMEAPAARIGCRMGYNVTGVSFSAGELAEQIRRRIPGFRCYYRPDFRQRIADTWPRSLDDSQARRDWGWEPECDLAFIVEDMIDELSKGPNSPR